VEVASSVSFPSSCLRSGVHAAVPRTSCYQRDVCDSTRFVQGVHFMHSVPELTLISKFYVLLTVPLITVFVNNQLDAQFFLLYSFIPILYMFRATKCSSTRESIVSIRPLVYVTVYAGDRVISRFTCIPHGHLLDCVYSCGIMHRRCCLQSASSVHYTTSCKHSLVLLRMGEIIARNMLS